MAQLLKVARPCTDDPQLSKDDFESVFEVAKVCPQIMLKCLYIARVGRPDFAGQSTRRPELSLNGIEHAKKERFARRTSYINCTHNHRQDCHVGNTASERKLSAFQDIDIAGYSCDSNLHPVECLGTFR